MPNTKSVVVTLLLFPALLACKDSRDYDLSTGPEIQLLAVTYLFVQVGWDDIYPEASKLKIERKREQDEEDWDEDREFKILAELPPTARDYVDSTVKDGRKYRYRLRAFFDNGKTDRTVILSVDVPVSPVPLLVASERSGKISPDGRLLARRNADRVLVIDLASGSRNPATIGDLGRESGFAWMPDSRHLVIAAGFPGGEDLYLTDTWNGESRALTQSGAGAADPDVTPDGHEVSFRRVDGMHKLTLDGLIEPAIIEPIWR